MVRIGGHEIGAGRRCFVIAEAGVNHNGDLDLALELVGAAADAGADAVKFQTFRAEAVASPSAAKAGYQLESTPAEESQLEMLRGLELGWDEHVQLLRRAQERGVLFLSSAFDLESVSLLKRLGVAALKVASAEVTNLPLLRGVAAAGLPVILSTGTADLEEVAVAVEALTDAGAVSIVLLHCVSAYPAPAADANLRAMATMAGRFGLPVGYSDHTEGDEVALAAVALGACVLEKHFTLDRSLPGPDQRASLEPAELERLVRGVRRVESALGDGLKRPTPLETENARAVRRSLAAADDLPAGARLTAGMLTALRPGTGISPTRIDEVVGRRLRRELGQGELLDPGDLE
ncbi:MAG TPA: N-acetylneuraminate synthase [Gaiellaceae bacterium]|jgi:N-acetylneuraminate synthase/N,N'-diacetyllegionaminate synthase|nr:N-acetylneuraminate synthase [Gaiellaceae bacterium]